MNAVLLAVAIPAGVATWLAVVVIKQRRAKPPADPWGDASHGGGDALRDAPAREMGVYIDDADEMALGDLAAHTWPDAEYSEIVRREKRLWRRAARRIRGRAGATS